MKLTDKAKELLKGLEKYGLKFSFEPDNQNFVTGKLADGTEISTDSDSFGVGAKVTVNGEPAPDGEHTLESGEVIVVSGGVITEVKPKETEVEIEMSAEDIEALANKASELGEQVGELTKEKETLTNEVATLTEANENFKKEIATLKAEVLKFSKQPASTSVKTATQENFTEEPKKRAQLIVEAMNATK